MRMLGVERVVTEGLDGFHVAQLSEVIIVPESHLLDLVGGADAVEAVDERHATLDGGQVGDGREVHDLLDATLGEHGEAGLAAGHDVGVVAEDVQRVGRHGTGGHVEHGGQALAGDLVHVGNHEQQALRRRVGRRDGARAQRAVDCACGAGLRLHLDDAHRRAEDVLLALGCPLVDVVGHGAGRGDRVDARHLGKRIRHVRRSVVTVHGLEFSRHILSLSIHPSSLHSVLPALTRGGPSPYRPSHTVQAPMTNTVITH